MLAEAAEAVLEKRREITGGRINMGFPATLERQQEGGGDGFGGGLRRFAVSLSIPFSGSFLSHFCRIIGEFGA